MAKDRDTDKFLLEVPKLSQLSDHQLAERIINLYHKTSDCGGLTLQQCAEKIPLEQLIAKTRHFIDQYEGHWKKPSQEELSLKVNIEQREGVFVDTFHIEIPSLLQRPGSHASNSIQAIYFKSKHNGCHSSVPTFIIVHHAVDDMSSIFQLADYLFVSGGSFNLMAIYLPQFGPRREGRSEEFIRKEKASADKVNMDFLSSDLDLLLKNTLQSFLDISVLRSWLLRQTDVKQEKLGLIGLSLGGIIAASYAGLHPEAFSSVLTMVAGGDLASMAFNNFDLYPDPNRMQSLQALNVDESRMRAALLPMDPLIWAGSTRVNKWHMINARHDELIERENGYMKLIRQLQNVKELRVDWIDTIHNPGNAGVFTQFTGIFLPILEFISPAQRKDMKPQCKRQERD